MYPFFILYTMNMLKEKILFWFNAIFFIVFWCIMMFKPDLALETLVIYFWLEFLLSGIVWVVFAIIDHEYEDRWVLAVVGALQIISGVLLIAYPAAWEAILRAFVILFWVWAIIKWILVILRCIQLAKAWFSEWWWILAFWAILLLLWIFLVSNSLLALFIVNGIIWLWLLFVGISMIILAFQVKKILKESLK